MKGHCPEAAEPPGEALVSAFVSAAHGAGDTHGKKSRGISLGLSTANARSFFRGRPVHWVLVLGHMDLISPAMARR